MLKTNLLALAAANLTDGIFNCFVYEIKCSSGIYYSSRYFESGAFKDFYYEAHEKIKQYLGCDELYAHSYYTKEDVIAEKERNSALKANRNCGMNIFLYKKRFIGDLLQGCILCSISG